MKRVVALRALSVPFLTGYPTALFAQDALSVRVGAIPIDPGGELFYAEQLGAFARRKLDVEVQMMNNGPAIAAAIAGGSLDLGLSDVLSVAAAHAHGLPFELVAPASMYTPQSTGHGLLVKKDAPIERARDFEGKTMAVAALHAVDQVMVQAWLDRGGANWRAVRFVELPYPSMAAALEAGTVDAIMIVEPFWSLTRGRFRAFTLGDSGIADRFLLSGYIASRAWLRQNGEAARRYASAIREVAPWANAHHQASAAILARSTKLPIAVLGSMDRSLYATTLQPGLLQPLIDAGVRYDAVSSAFPAAEIVFEAG